MLSWDRSKLLHRESGHGRVSADRGRKGSISIYFSLIFVMIAALILTITESARSFSQRFYFQLAVNSSMESLFSQYHRTLWERYRILGLEYRNDGDLMDEFYEFMQPYVECRDLFPAYLDRDEIFFSEESILSEDAAMEEEILEYMKYGMAESLLHFAEAEYQEGALGEELGELFERAEEGKPTDHLQKDYQLDSRDLKRIEDLLLKISRACREEKLRHTAAGEALSEEAPNSFYRESGKFKKELEKIEKLAEQFPSAVQILEEKVRALRARYESEKGDLGDEASEIINTEISEYESYVSEKGELRERIAAMISKAKELTEAAENMEKSVEEFEEWVDEAFSNLEEDEDDDWIYDAIHSFYQSSAQSWRGYSLIEYELEVSEINEECKSMLDGVRNLSEGKLLEFVLPSGVPVPSRDPWISENPALHPGSQASVIDLAMLGEYSLRFFNTYHYRENSMALPRSGSTRMEVEYLLGGCGSDYENLYKNVERMLYVRELMNLLFLYRTPEMRESARAFVTTILCATANPLLISVMTFFVLGVWAYGQAIVDVRTLLSDGRVPVIHTKESFSLSLEGLLKMGQGKNWENGNSGKNGLSYKDYLRVFLFGEGLKSQSVLNFRMQNLIEHNLRFVGEDASRHFSFSNCLYGASVMVPFSARHILSDQGVVALVRGVEQDAAYSFEIQSYYKYKNEEL